MSDVPGQSGHALPIGQYPVRARGGQKITKRRDGQDDQPQTKQRPLDLSKLIRDGIALQIYSNDRNVGRGFADSGNRPRRCSENSVDITANQIGRSLRQRLRVGSILGRKVLAFHVAQFSHTPVEGRIVCECSQMLNIWHLGQMADHRHRRLLRPRR